MKEKKYLIKNKKIILKTLSGEKEISTLTQIGCTLEVLINNVDKVMPTGDITKLAAKLYRDRTSKIYKELTGRHVRSLRERGFIAKVKKGHFVFTGEYTNSRRNPFTKKVRDEIIKRDDYTCQMCLKTQEQGADLTADHIKPQDSFGSSTADNGMCLCTKCENIKSNYNVMGFGKKMFEKYLKTAMKEKDKENIVFFEDILRVFKEHGRK